MNQNLSMEIPVPYPMRPLFAGEIARTEQSSPSLRCHCCKNSDTQRIVDTRDLIPFAAYYAGSPFKVQSCYACGALWHWPQPIISATCGNRGDGIA